MAADLVSGFSIWAVPEDPAVQELSEVVEEYAARMETPAFLPHMTVLSGVKVMRTVKTAATCVALPAIREAASLSLWNIGRFVPLRHQGWQAEEAVAKMKELAASTRALEVEIQTVTFKVST
ncbi:hypothetical protein BBJ28_00013160 [Nothophytophthora sp. Chile5]|nr:hypothetical protein BBJ28_00013160 [Nothophytophthora sp. Chile5]